MSATLQALGWAPLAERPEGLIWDSKISRLGWSRQGDTLRLVTELQGKWFQFEGESLGLASAYARRTQAVLLALNRLLYHDLNGKIMGIDGILTIWGLEIPDEALLKEDIGLLRGSLGHLKGAVKLVDVTADIKNIRPLKFSDLRECVHPFLMRNFNPPNYLEWEESPGGVTCCPAWLVHQLWETSRVAAVFRAPEEKVKILLQAEGDLLCVKLECQALARFLEAGDSSTVKELPRYVFDWFALLQLVGGEVVVSGNEINVKLLVPAQPPALGEVPLLLEGTLEEKLLKMLPLSVVAGPYQISKNGTLEERKLVELALRYLVGVGITTI